MPACRVAAAGRMAQTQGAALEGQLPIGLHLRCCSRYYYTADTKSPILNQRAAALFVLIEENAPGRHRAAADRMGLAEIDFAQIAPFHIPLHHLAVRTETVLIADGQLLPGFFSGVQHLPCVRHGFRHRLFTHNMLASFQRRDGDFAVTAVRRTDMHHVDRLVFQQIMIVGVYLRAFHAVCLRRLLRPFHDDIAESDQLNPVGLTGQRRQVLSVGNAAAADDSDFQLAHFLTAFRS